jgi:hypothetical protein
VHPATARQAAARLERSPITIRQWARRYQARVLGRAGREVIYDFDDLATIEGCIWRGDEVPPTPEVRDKLRCQVVIDVAEFGVIWPSRWPVRGDVAKMI